MSELFTGHEAEIEDDAEATYTPAQAAISRLETALAILEYKAPALDFLEQETEEMRMASITGLIRDAIAILKK